MKQQYFNKFDDGLALLHYDKFKVIARNFSY